MSEFMRLVDDIWVRWTNEADFVADIWFRGHADMIWLLIPSALRPPFSSVSEHRYRHDFKLRAQPFLNEATQLPKDDWDWYFLMQHYGVPTRLLDWTESALVGLYFAIQSAPGTDGCVWILNPRQINVSLAKIGSFIPIYSDDLVASYLPAALG
ncbi:MAG: FRG domain-containing protein [Pirellulaceae bacterium]